jgi:hypothetical protein
VRDHRPPRVGRQLVLVRIRIGGFFRRLFLDDRFARDALRTDGDGGGPALAEGALLPPAISTLSTRVPVLSMENA